MNFGKLDEKTVEKSMINTIFKEQVIFEPVYVKAITKKVQNYK